MRTAAEKCEKNIGQKNKPYDYSSNDVSYEQKLFRGKKVGFG